MKSRAFAFSFFLSLLIVLSSCSRNDPDVIAERDRKRILEYIEENDLDAIELDEGVFVAITREGAGGHPTETSSVKMNYIGYLLNGNVFDEGYNARISLPGAVRGFRIGIMAFRRGGEGTILIPSAAGYEIGRAHV